MAKPETSKKDAVLAIGLDRATAEIISLAATQGVRVSRTYVDLLKQQSRADQPRKKGPAKRAAKSPAKRRTTKKSPGAPAAAGGESKAAYVRSFPPGTKAAEIVARGKEAGIVLTTKYVYRVRESGGSASAPTTGKKSAVAAASRTPRAKASPTKTGDAEAAFASAVVALVIDGGVPAARARFEDIIAKILGAASVA